MSYRPYVAALLAALALLPATPAFAAGEILITHGKILAGNLTPGDTAGYPGRPRLPAPTNWSATFWGWPDKIGLQITSLMFRLT